MLISGSSYLVIEAGAVLHYAGDVRFVGFDSKAQAPNGAWLTSDTDESFIGRAHWPSAKRVQ